MVHYARGTSRGSRPDSLADLLFNFTFHQLMCQVKDDLDRDGLNYPQLGQVEGKGAGATAKPCYLSNGP